MDTLEQIGQRVRKEVRLVHPEEVATWQKPTWQRDLRVNKKVLEYRDNLKGEWGGVMPGTITLGILRGDPKHVIWYVDGQHRLHAFKTSGLDECIMEIDTRWFHSQADMRSKFVELNSRLVRLTPDDNLRAIATDHTELAVLKEACPAIGYGSVRRKGNKHMISMSVLLRCWAISRTETPASAVASAEDLGTQLTKEDCRHLINFMDMASAAWGIDREYHRLWGQLNVTLCLWLYRRLVLDRDRSTKRRVVLSVDQFQRCMMRLTATHMYVDWLAGQSMHIRSRAPAYYRVCDAFAASLKEDGIARPIFPKPEWAMGRKA